jgi:hypothetical protein
MDINKKIKRILQINNTKNEELYVQSKREINEHASLKYVKKQEKDKEQ